jgi:hypothetical protein
MHAARLFGRRGHPLATVQVAPDGQDVAVHVPPLQTWPLGQSAGELQPQWPPTQADPAAEPAQLLPQVPQLELVLSAAQVPAQQASPDAQVVPQAPQLDELFLLTQTPLQSIVSAPQLGHVPVQTPPTQLWPVEQAAVHEPQWPGSVLKFTHMPLQLVSPAGQETAHPPPEQTWPAGQTTPQAPQLVGSLLVLTHRLPQAVSPAGHEIVHVLLTHAWPAAHLVPQDPQLFGSLLSVTQTLPPQQVWLDGQDAPLLPHGVRLTQTPPTQLSPVLQEWPQAPQLLVSLLRFLQAVPQAVCGAGQRHPSVWPEAQVAGVTQWPLLHVWPWAQQTPPQSPLLLPLGPHW